MVRFVQSTDHEVVEGEISIGVEVCAKLLLTN